MSLEFAESLYEIDAYVRQLRVRGTLTVVPARRLSDALNDTEDAFLVLRQAAIYRMHTQRQETSVQADLISVAKQQLELIEVVSEVIGICDHVLQSDMVISKVPHAVVVFLPNFLVRGTLHLLSEVKLHEALEVTHYDFVAVTSASIIPASGTRENARQVPFVSVGKRHILAMYQDKESI